MRWSVVVPAHNCAHFLGQTLAEVVAQLGSRPDAEIIVVDDASSDDPETVVRRVGGDRVRYERNPRNLGAVATFNRGIRLARGEFVHLLHGDDVVLPGFYRAMEAVLRTSEAPMALCRTADIDDTGRELHRSRHYREGTGVWEGAFEALAVSNRVRAPGAVVRRDAYAEHGVFRTDLPHAADWELWTRMSANGPVAFVDEVLAGYRRHEGSDTAARARTGVNIRERVTAIGTIGTHVPQQDRRRLARKALLFSSVYAARSCLAFARDREWGAARVQAHEGLRCLLRVPGGAVGPAGATR